MCLKHLTYKCSKWEEKNTLIVKSFQTSEINHEALVFHQENNKKDRFHPGKQKLRRGQTGDK